LLPPSMLGDERVGAVLRDIVASGCPFALLDLTNDHLTDRVCPMLVNLFTQGCTLQGLYLGGNSFTSEGLGVLAEGLSQCPSLRSLELNRCNIDVKGLATFVGALSFHSLRDLDLSDNPFSSPSKASSSSLADVVDSSPSFNSISQPTQADGFVEVQGRGIASSGTGIDGNLPHDVGDFLRRLLRGEPTTTLIFSRSARTDRPHKPTCVALADRVSRLVLLI